MVALKARGEPKRCNEGFPLGLLEHSGKVGLPPNRRT